MTLVSILGDFHSSILPISYEFKDEISKHIIVYDDDHGDVKEAERIIRGQKSFFETLSHDGAIEHEIITLKIEEDSYSSILRCLDRIKQSSNEYDDIYLNTTDGLSSVAIVLSSHILDIGGKVISYDRYANTYNLHTSLGMEKHRIKHNMDIETHLLMKGYRLLEIADNAVLESRKSYIYQLTKDLIRFKKFADQMYGKKMGQIPKFDDYKRLLNTIGITNQKYIQGTVFEEYIYSLMVDNFSAEFDDIRMGVKVEFEEGVENEFDILMIKDNHLHTIECKLVKNLNGELHVYKTELIMEYIDDDGKAMILSIGSENENNNKQKYGKVKFSNGSKARAKYGDIKIHQSLEFSEQAFLDDVQEWFLT